MKLFKIIYSRKYRDFGCRLHGRHCVIVKIASGKPKNCLVRLRGGVLVVIPYGNLKFARNL